MGLVALVVVGVLYCARREWQARRAREPHPEQQPEFVEHLLYACLRAGHPNVAIGVVTGGGAAFAEYHGGLLLASPELGGSLNMAELVAVVRHVLAAPADLSRRLLLESLWPWAVAGVPVLAVSLWLGRPLFAVALVAALVAAAGGRGRDLAGERTIRAMFHRYQEQGGDPAAYISAVIRLYGSGPAGGRGISFRARRHLHVLAGEAGFTAETVAALVSKAGAPQAWAEPPLLGWWQRLGDARYIAVGLAVAAGWAVLFR
jgi:hypothetical protein